MTHTAARLAALFAAAGTLLVGCTGTVETLPPAQFALLTRGGNALQTLKLAGDAGSHRINADLGEPVSVRGGRSLVALEGGRSFALVRASSIESYAPNLKPNTTFEAPPFAACWKTAVGEPAGEALLALSECGGEAGAQNVALYSAAGRLLWWAALPVGGAPDTGVPGQPPLRLGLVGRVGVVARPALGGGSELMRVAEVPGNRSEGAANKAQVSAPTPTLAVRDLTTYRQGNAATIYAATDEGIFRLKVSGELEEDPLAAFGALRYNRVWATDTAVQGAPLLLGLLGGEEVAGQSIRVWNGTANKATDAAVLTALSDVQDTALSEGYLYVLTSQGLSRYDALLGLGQGRWLPERLGVRVEGARALVELAPQP